MTKQQSKVKLINTSAFCEYEYICFLNKQYTVLPLIMKSGQLNFTKVASKTTRKYVYNWLFST